MVLTEDFKRKSRLERGSRNVWAVKDGQPGGSVRDPEGHRSQDLNPKLLRPTDSGTELTSALPAPGFPRGSLPARKVSAFPGFRCWCHPQVWPLELELLAKDSHSQVLSEGEPPH
ncbi:hypothetical protein CB1_000743136 [Camelus ferus]|nr:hypothetical protein CB1_000743136 [Camelus ferus]